VVLATGGEVAAQEEIAIRPVGIYRILAAKTWPIPRLRQPRNTTRRKGCGRDQRAGAARYANWQTTFQRDVIGSVIAFGDTIHLALERANRWLHAQSLMLKSAHEFSHRGKTGTKWGARYASAVLNSVVRAARSVGKSL